VVPGLRRQVIVPRRRDRTTKAKNARGSPIELEGIVDKDLPDEEDLDDEK
jgi:hypothetical protein